MLEEILAATHNWFEVDVVRDEFTVVDSVFAVPEGFLQDGQYFRIVGSVFNDGLHVWPAADLIDEVFDGEVWSLAVPKAVQNLAEDVKAWCAKYEDMPSPYTSESFGGYSYSRATNADGCAIGWRDVFRSELNRWRKLP